MREALTYDDVTLVPRYSEIESRHDVDLSIEIFAGGDHTIKLLTPIIGAPMDTVCGPEMCIKLWKIGAIGVLHRYNEIDKQCELFQKVKESNCDTFVAIGATGDFFSRAEKLYELGCRLFCIDVAHGDHIFVKKAIDVLRAEYGNEIHIMAGNICTAGAMVRLRSWGADSVRVGVGGGAVCSTRIVTGHGVPNLTALQEIKKFTTPTGLPCLVIADGGIRTSGDVAKALGIGADLVMVGSMLAGTEESPPVVKLRNDGETRTPEKVLYRGMASKEAQAANGRVSIVEGISAAIPYKGSVEDVVSRIRHGLQSALSYSGANNLKEFKQNAHFRKVSGASQIESRPHIK